MVKRPINVTRNLLRQLFFQRCFYLFATLLGLIALAPFIEPTRSGMLIRNVANTFVILSAVAAVGRSITSFLVVLALAGPSIVLRAISGSDMEHLDLALKFDAAVYAVAIVLLLRYVFDREVITADRLWGAAAAFLMMGLLWTFLYAIADRADAGSFLVRGESASLSLFDLIYFSFSTMTTTGFGDIVPLGPIARTMATLQVIVGQLFIAILIAKLVGVYPPARQREASKLQEGALNLSNEARAASRTNEVAA